jgi:two-component system chemotaxis response regulator CheY
MRALIVDDSKFLRSYLRQHLERLGVECAESENGSQALHLLRVIAGFDVIFVDVNMPVMGGLECVRHIRDEHLAAAMKVMMVTTEADHSFITQALDDGADEFLMKPFTSQSLREKLLLLGFEMAA